MLGKVFVNALVELFHPILEITIFDTKKEVIEILNAFSSLKEDIEFFVNKNEGTFIESMKIGKEVRCYVHSDESGYYRFRYDTSVLSSLHQQLGMLLGVEFKSKDKMESWKEAIDQIIEQNLAKKKVTLAGATTKQKREILSHIEENGLLEFKESSIYVAGKLKISRATVYNYLKTSSEYRKVRVHQVDAFTTEKFGGNPAGVVLDAEMLDEGTMRKITRELNLSETAFVLPSKKADFRLRYFTPTGHEIGFCGHSTVGALYMIAKERKFGIKREGRHPFIVETLNGQLKMEINLEGEDLITVSYNAPEIKLKTTNISYEAIASTLGIDPSWINRNYPIAIEKTNRDLFVVINSLDHLGKIECDMKKVTQFSKEQDLVAVCLLTNETFDKANQFHMRCFAPLVGIGEDPFTGSVLGGLTAYVHENGLIAKEKRTFKVEQGHFLERPGVVKVEFSVKNHQYDVKVIAKAIHCFSTEIGLK